MGGRGEGEGGRGVTETNRSVRGGVEGMLTSLVLVRKSHCLLPHPLPLRWTVEPLY